MKKIFKAKNKQKMHKQLQRARRQRNRMEEEVSLPNKQTLVKRSWVYTSNHSQIQRMLCKRTTIVIQIAN